MDPCKFLQRQGFDVTFLPVNADATIDLEKFKATIRDDTILITMMHVNNEVGTILPIKEVGQIAKEKGIIFHVDAVQVLVNCLLMLMK